MQCPVMKNFIGIYYLKSRQEKLVKKNVPFFCLS